MTTQTAETTVQPLSAREKISVAGMFLGVFAVGIDSFVISPLLTPMSKSLAGSVAAVAIGVTTYAVAYAVSAPILAPLGDRYRPANIAIVGITIFAVATLATSFQNSLIGFYTVRAVAGVGGAMYTPNIQAHVSRRYDPIMRGKLIGIIMAGLSASIVLGVPFGAWAANVMSWRQVFPFITVLGVLAAIILGTTRVAALTDKSKTPTSPVPKRSLGVYLQAFSTSKVRFALGATLTWMTGFYGIYTFLGTFLSQQLSINVAKVGTYLMVYGIGNFIATFTAGWINARLGSGSRPVIVFGVINIGAVFALTTIPLTPLSVVTIFLVWAASQGYAATALIGMAASAAPAQVSTVLALNSSFIYVGLALGSAIFGQLLDYGSVVGMWMPAAVLTIMAMISARASTREK